MGLINLEKWVERWVNNQIVLKIDVFSSKFINVAQNIVSLCRTKQ